jgi:plastocyanin
MKPRILLAAICLASALVSTTPLRSAPISTRIAIIDYAFVPAEQTISIGESITWHNDGQEPHNVTDANSTWESPALSNGQSYSFTFTTLGTYTYYCTIHSGMLGTIIVTEPQPLPQTKVYIATIQH